MLCVRVASFSLQLPNNEMEKWKQKNHSERAGKEVGKKSSPAAYLIKPLFEKCNYCLLRACFKQRREKSEKNELQMTRLQLCQQTLPSQ
mmetsp:Transcript_20192/g.23277  ORF Transcript_20192/g.23277 Transcript_20192/m.23277 type:complete len:89 (+) Transcript_20192:1325-1591(+)